jgi:hypothetical protein
MIGRFWVTLLAYSALLGVYLIILGIALAGLVSALKKRESRGGRPFHGRQISREDGARPVSAPPGDA